MKAILNGKRVTKWYIAVLIENLPGNTPWGLSSQMTLHYDTFTLPEIVEKYNTTIEKRGINTEKIEIL